METGMNIAYDNTSLIKDGKRWFPIMGEIHYSRYPDSDWKRELLKMKAGGVDLVSSYVIWIHHEEIEGEWDFSDWRNLRGFVGAVKDAGLAMILRIGPWVHAEVRNGGFPDWLLQKCPNARTNDEPYFKEVGLLKMNSATAADCWGKKAKSICNTFCKWQKTPALTFPCTQRLAGAEP